MFWNRKFDFTFYCANGSDDWIVSPNYPNGTPATIKANYDGIPGSQLIWDNFACKYCQITVIKSSFLIATASEAIFYMTSDDDATATINNQKSCSTIYGVHKTCSMTEATKTGLNKLKIVVKNYGGPGVLGYMLEVKITIW